MISIASGTVGALTMTGWKRRSRAPSFSMYLRYSSSVVAPMVWISPRDSAGFSMLEASMAPSAAPAPMSVWSSSRNSTTFSDWRISFITAFRRSSNWPRYLVPATSAPRSSCNRRLFTRTSGTSWLMIFCASPSTIAVLPTPGSPMSTGLFLVRRARIWMTRSISCSRPITGSSLVSRASCVRSRLAWGVNGTSPNVRVLGNPASARSTSAFTVSSRSPSRCSTAVAMPSPSRMSPSSTCSVPTKSWRNRPASSRARMMTRRARSVNRSNTGAPHPFHRRTAPVFPATTASYLGPTSVYPAALALARVFLHEQLTLRISSHLQRQPAHGVQCSTHLTRAALDEAVNSVRAPGQLGIVRGDQERDPALGLKLHEQVVDDLARLGVQVARRLVSENHARLVHQRTRDRDPLLLAARHLARPVMRPIAEADFCQGHRRPLTRLAAGAPRGHRPPQPGF